MILLASSSEKNLSRWEQAVSGRAPVFCSTDMDSVKQELVRIKPQILLLDYTLPRLNGPAGISGLMKLNPQTRMVILTSLISTEIEWDLFKTGVRGCCRSDIEPEQLKIIVESVQRGELWLRRTLSRHLLNELIAITKEKNKMKPAISGLLAI